MTVVMYRSQQHGRRGQRIIHDNREHKARNIGDVKLVAFFLGKRWFPLLSFVVESKVSLNSC